LAGSTAKKVLIRRFDREPLSGFVNSQAYLQAHGVELLSPAGTLTTIPYGDIKVVCFVRDFDVVETDPSKRIFHTRPKMEGLWVRMRMRDGEVLDGLLPNELLSIGAEGFTVTPPDSSSNNQKLFVPRAALDEIKVLGVVGSPLTRQKKKAASEDQIGLFE
jgi:hypothetical protein